MDGTILNFYQKRIQFSNRYILTPLNFHLDFQVRKFLNLRVLLILIISRRDVTFFLVSLKKQSSEFNPAIQVHLIYFKANNYRPHKIHLYLFWHICCFVNIVLRSLSKENSASPYTCSCDPPKRCIPITRESLRLTSPIYAFYGFAYPRIAGWRVYPRKKDQSAYIR